MTIERFLNHIYYSFAAIDRTFSYSIDYRKEDNTVLVAGMIMCFSLGGYVVAAFYTVVLFPMHLLGIFFSSQKELLMSFVVGGILLGPLMKSFNNYDRYFMEFRSNPNYKKRLWNVVASVFCIIGHTLLLLIVVILG